MYDHNHSGNGYTVGAPGFGFSPGNPYGGTGGGYGLNAGGYGSTGNLSYGTGLGFGNGLAAGNSGGTDQFGLPTNPVNFGQASPPPPNQLASTGGQTNANPHFAEADARWAADAWDRGGFNLGTANAADRLMRMKAQ
jgi:hypothetical protein